MIKIEEWTPENKWNPFNSYKLLAHIERWQHIDPLSSNIPHPVLVTIDPINKCNLFCKWCNSGKILKETHNKISTNLLFKIGNFLKDWSSSYPFQGVKAVCIAGGGEPLLHPGLSELIKNLVSKKIEVGVVTNGTKIPEHIQALSVCTWVGVSIDASTPSTYTKCKGRDLFSEVIDNVKTLVDYSVTHKTRLATENVGYGVSYKYLLHPMNQHDVYKAAAVAKSIGCKNLHIRPYGIPWDKLSVEQNQFSLQSVQDLFQAIEKARDEYEDKTFKIVGVIHKFDPQTFSVDNQFSKCHAIYMTGVFMPGAHPNTFSFGLCCDRRGDDSLLLVKDGSTPESVQAAWGKDEHRKIFNGIKVKDCPRCTYQPHNQIYEHVILNDSMTWRFI